MACMLRLGGKELDVKSLIRSFNLEVSKVWIKGEAKFRNRPDKLNTNSGLNIIVSDAEFNEFSLQKEQAEVYLSDNLEQLKKVVQYQGVDNVYIDFGIEWRDVYIQSDYFPASLVKLAGEIGLGIEITQYSPEGSDEHET